MMGAQTSGNRNSRTTAWTPDGALFAEVIGTGLDKVRAALLKTESDKTDRE
jgi:hypothetical protein